MKVSILLISYNQQEYIKECVESILRQEVTFDVEIIAADDQSTDATPEIIAGLLKQSKFRHKTLVDKQNLGMHKNYQRGFAACSGEYLAIMEGDDYWSDPTRLQKHITFLDAHPECVMSFNRLMIYNQANGTYKPQTWDYPDSLRYITTAMLAERNLIGNLSACVIRKSAFMKLKPDLHEMGFADWMLGMAMGELGQLVKFRETMSVYRKHDEGIWSGRSKRENLKRMIKYTIDKCDRFMDYRYHEEFMKHKRRLKTELRNMVFKKFKTNVIKFTPEFILNILRMLRPVSLRKL